MKDIRELRKSLGFLDSQPPSTGRSKAPTKGSSSRFGPAEQQQHALHDIRHVMEEMDDLQRLAYLTEHVPPHLWKEPLITAELETLRADPILWRKLTSWYEDQGYDVATLEKAVPLPKKHGKNQADMLIEYAQQYAILLTTAEGARYAVVPVDGHQEVLAMGEKGSGFRDWLAQEFYQENGRSASQSALTQSLETLRALARFQGVTAEVYTRLAYVGGALYLDLANDAHQVIEITQEGWSVLNTSPVYFRRRTGMLPLPLPDRNGTMQHFYDLLPEPKNAVSSTLMTAWILSIFLPNGAYPILCIHGESGSAKSSVTKLLRNIIDPNQAPMRNTPEDARNLFIAANNSAVLAFDNLSHLPAWLSDGLCTVSTGAGHGERRLYSDDEEILFSVRRPIVLNGIAEVATRGDLLNRCLFVVLPFIGITRQAEIDLSALFVDTHALVLGAILDVVSATLKAYQTTQLTQLPRMADFAVWIESASAALHWKPGAFLKRYEVNRQEASRIELESSHVATELLKLLSPYKVTGKDYGLTDLYDSLTAIVTNDGKRPSPKDWPKSARGLGGSLRRLASCFRAEGWNIVSRHTMKGTEVSCTWTGDIG